MKVIEVPIDRIQVGERRRADYGDIAGLAKGIQRVGLLEPVIIDPTGQKGVYRLIAGERRLRAVKMLKWTAISAVLREQLTDLQLRDIELEENENRKPLTEQERRRSFASSKKVVENAKRAAEVLAQSAPKPDQKGTKGGRPKEPDSTRAVADALGANRRDIERAEYHVETAERFPWLQSDAWRQADVLRLRKYLARIPAEEHEPLCQMMERTAAPFAPRPDRVLEYAEVMSMKTPEARAEIFRMLDSDDEREQSLARTRALHRPPMPDARTAYIREALSWLEKALKSPFDTEPELSEFRAMIAQLHQLHERIKQRYEQLKEQEARYAEEDVRRGQNLSA